MPHGTAPLALLELLLPLAGCDDDGGGTAAPPEVARGVLEAPLTELELGDSTQLTARVLGSSGQELTGRTITWSSSNEAVLRVSQTGVVTGVGPGSATITAAVASRRAWGSTASSSSTTCPKAPSPSRSRACPNCTVQDQNPRDVEVPGTTSFDVVCQQAATCSDAPPPPSDWGITVATYMDPEEEYQGSSGTHGILEADFGIAHVRATATDGTQSGKSNTYFTQVTALGYYYLVPVDPARMGDTISLQVRFTAWGEAAGDWTAFEFGAQWGLSGSPERAGVHGSSTGPISRSFDEIVPELTVLGSWQPFMMTATAQAVAYDGGSGAAEGRFSVEFVDAREKAGGQPTGPIVPIAEICTASGKTY